MMVKRIESRCSAFILPDANRARVSSEVGIVAVIFHARWPFIKILVAVEPVHIELVSVVDR